MNETLKLKNEGEPARGRKTSSNVFNYVRYAPQVNQNAAMAFNSHFSIFITKRFKYS